MDTHIRGPVTSGQNDGAIVSQRGFQVLFTDVSTKSLVTINAAANKPVLVEITPIIETVFNAGTTNLLAVGNATTPNAYLGVGDINPTALGVQPSKKFLLRAKTTITAIYTPTGIAATTGRATFIVAATGVGRGVGITS
jgi:hypothetical protein